MQIPLLVSQVKTDLIFIERIVSLLIFSIWVSSIISPALTIKFWFISKTSSTGHLPKILSERGEVIFPDSTISSIITPLVVPQSFSLITASWATSTSLLVR